MRLVGWSFCILHLNADSNRHPAQSSLRDQLSQAVFDEVLHDREEAASNVLAALCTLTDKWGIVVDAVKLKNISVDVSMIRAMGRRAEAERLKEARIIEASAEFEASRMLVQAGREFGDGTQSQLSPTSAALLGQFDPIVLHLK